MPVSSVRLLMLPRGDEGRSWHSGSTRAVTLPSRSYHQPPDAGRRGVHAFALDALPLRLGLIGTFALTAGAESIDLPLAAQRLVAFLALQERPVRREHVAGRLWPDVAETRAHAALRTTLWRATRACAGLSGATARTSRWPRTSTSTCIRRRGGRAP